jgi:hypothetical protein
MKGELKGGSTARKSGELVTGLLGGGDQTA